MKLSNFSSCIFLLCILAAFSGKKAQAEIPDSTLISIQNGYNKREKGYDSPFLKSDWNSGVVHIQKGTRSLVLDFN
jgi:hypothetical protein